MAFQLSEDPANRIDHSRSDLPVTYPLAHVEDLLQPSQGGLIVTASCQSHAADPPVVKPVGDHSRSVLGQSLENPNRLVEAAAPERAKSSGPVPQALGKGIRHLHRPHNSHQ